MRLESTAKEDRNEIRSQLPGSRGRFGRFELELDLAEELHPQLRRTADPVRRHRRLPAPLARAIDAVLAPEPLDRPTISALAARLEEVPGVVSPRSPRPD